MKIHVFESINGGQRAIAAVCQESDYNAVHARVAAQCKTLAECFRVSTFDTTNPGRCEALTYFDCAGRPYQAVAL